MPNQMRPLDSLAFFDRFVLTLRAPPTFFLQLRRFYAKYLVDYLFESKNCKQ